MTYQLPGAQCLACRHFIGSTVRTVDGSAVTKVVGRCAAFHEIPGPIFGDQFDHRQPYPGDHGVRFAPVTGQRSPFEK